MVNGVCGVPGAAAVNTVVEGSLIGLGLAATQHLLMVAIHASGMSLKMKPAILSHAKV